MLGSILMADDSGPPLDGAEPVETTMSTVSPDAPASPSRDYGGLARARSDGEDNERTEPDDQETGSVGREGGKRGRKGKDAKGKGKNTRPTRAERRSPPPPGQPSTQSQQGPTHRVYEMGPRRTRVLLIGNLSGRLQMLNNIVKQTGANVVAHSGTFGFFDDNSYARMDIDRLRARLSSVPHLQPNDKTKLLALPEEELRAALRERMMFSDLPLFLAAKRKLLVPVYTIWGANEDIEMVERLRNGTCAVENLFILDHTKSYKIADVRLLGLGGQVDYSRLLDQGCGDDVAGECDRLWVTLSQIADLLKTAESVNDPTEVRMLVTYASAGQEPLVAMLAHSLQCDFTASGHLRTNMCVAYNHWSVQDPVTWSTALGRTQQAVESVWAAASGVLRSACSEEEYALLQRAVDVTKQLPTLEETRPTWNIGMCDAGTGHAIMLLSNGKVGITTYCEGRDFTPRRRHAEKSQRNAELKQRMEREKEREAQEKRDREGEEEVAPADRDKTEGERPESTEDGMRDGSTVAMATPAPSNDVVDGAATDSNRSSPIGEQEFAPTPSPIEREGGMVVFVKGLPAAFTRDDVVRFFGVPESAKITALGKPGSFYVEVEDRDSAVAACQKHKEIVEGKEIIVEIARPSSRRGQDRRGAPAARPVRSGPPPCRYYLRDRSCRSGSACKFAHIDK